MRRVSNKKLIEKATSVINSRRVGDYIIGDVGSALVTDKDTIYCGVCIDTRSGMGFCAEHAAIAAMVTAGEYIIKKLVAVWKDEEGNVHILPPCGRCREFIRQIHKDNLLTEIILKDKVVSLADLLPYSGWS